jgi:hypothetical protein
MRRALDVLMWALVALAWLAVAAAAVALVLLRFGDP